MSKKDDTYEMLDDTPEASKKSIILLLILVLLMVGGISAYLQKQSTDQVTVTVTEPSQKEPPASTPPPAAVPLVPISAVVNFDEASAVIKPDQMAKLQAFYQQIKNSAGTLQIYGYTDNLGSSQEGLTLSKQRAEAAAAYLQSLGSSDKIKFQADGFGEKNPVGDNATARGRLQNRRVELKFIPAP